MGLLDILKKEIDNVKDLPILSGVISKANNTKELSVSPDESEATSSGKEDSSSMWERLGFSPKTLELIKMCLQGGVIDPSEKAYLMRRVEEEGIDPREFDFVMAKTLESYRNKAKNAIKELSVLFSTAEKMAAQLINPDKSMLMSLIPNLFTSRNDYMIGGMLSEEAVDISVTTFINAPSNVDSFKTEIIQMLEIPMLPEVMVDFLGFAQKQISGENRRKKSKGMFSGLSKVFFKNEVALIPALEEKMHEVITNAERHFGNNPVVMDTLEEWRYYSPLKELKILNDPQEIENFPLPTYASDYIALVKYSYEMAESSQTTFRGAFAQLNMRLIKENEKYIDLHPAVNDAITKNKVRLVTVLMSNCENKVFMTQFKTPKDLNDLLEVLNFLSTRKGMKKYHKEIYKKGLQIFEYNPEAIKRIQQFKPRNMFGL